MRENWRDQQSDAASGAPLFAALFDLVDKSDDLVDKSDDPAREGTTENLWSVLTGPFSARGKLNIPSPTASGRMLGRLDKGALADLKLTITSRKVNGWKLITITKISGADAAAEGPVEPVAA